MIAAAVARDAAVYLFDEPTSGVDRRHLDAIGQQLRELASAGHVVLVITHDPELVDACADTIIALHPLNATDANTNKAKRSAPQTGTIAWKASHWADRADGGRRKQTQGRAFHSSTSTLRAPPASRPIPRPYALHISPIRKDHNDQRHRHSTGFSNC
jgi:ABC-type multidrug transport system ATPase subunit